MHSFDNYQQCFELNPIVDWKPVKRNARRCYTIIFSLIVNWSSSCVLHTLEFFYEIL